MLGQNVFNWMSKDGQFVGRIKAQGCHHAGEIYAKQLSADNDLRAFGDWFVSVGASVGDQIRLTWISATDVIIEKI